MQDALGPGTILGYGTNVHAGAALAEIRSNLERYALEVKRQVCPDRPMGVGLWLPAEAMTEVGLLPYTLNGFPFEDFHQPVVKDRVYLPHWADPDRVQYTLGLAAILADLLPDEQEGSISTLPIGWPSSFCGDAGGYDAQAQKAADHLLDLVHTLARIELDTGKHIHVDLEPEPGCILETSEGLVRFFERYLLGGADDVSVLGYLRVCHDVCHAAVMFEEQADVLRHYRDAGIKVGKVQLSSAVRVPFDEMDDATRTEALAALRRFDEPRYLHQTTVRLDDGRINTYLDLPDALADLGGDGPRGEWRVHFHVPVFADALGPLGTTRDEIARCLAALEPGDETHHFEVETYAWDVLPDDWQTDDLAAGIAEELRSVQAAGSAS
jgi:sugar phosphate isomerase/epimerase